MMPAFRSVAASLILLLTVLPSAPLLAQTTVIVTSGSGAPPKVVRGVATDLSTLLDKLDWNVAERGPLLIVAPELATRPVGKTEFDAQRGQSRSFPPPELPEPGRDGLYRTTSIDKYFGRRTHQVGTLTALIPETMTVFRKDLPESTAYLMLTRDERWRLLQTRLTPAQWKRLASEQGLGASDLPRKDRDLFLSVLPDPFIVTVRQESDQVPQQAIQLTDAQKEQVHISIANELAWTYQSGQNGIQSIISPRSREIKAKLRMVYTGNPFGEPGKVGQVVLQSPVPNRLKPSDLDLADKRLQATVSLTDAKTVGDLVKRIADASGIELHADFRYKNLSVHVRGDAVRARDLLEALCLSVTGTFRKLSDGKTEAFVLTHDREGTGTMQARMAIWGKTNNLLRAGLEKELEANLKQIPFADYLTYRSDDTMVPDEKLRQRIRANQELQKTPFPPFKTQDEQMRLQRERQLWVPIAQLPPEAQEMVKQHIEMSQASGNQGSDALRTDAVSVGVSQREFYIIPGLGSVRAALPLGWLPPTPPDFPSPVTAQNSVPNPYPLPSGYTERGAYVVVTTPEEATQVASLARSKGMNQLWLDVPPSLTPDVFAAIVQSAKKAAPALSVFALVRPLRLPAGEETAKIADLNILSETRSQWVSRLQHLPSTSGDALSAYQKRARSLTGDFIAGNEPGAFEPLSLRLKTLAKTSGLSGFAVQERYVPGYLPQDQNVGIDERFGYTLTNRLAFLRASGADPIDLTAGNISLDSNPELSFQRLEFEPPFLTSPGPGVFQQDLSPPKRDEWAQFRLKEAAAFDKKLFDALKGSVPKLYCDIPIDWPYSHPYQFVPWEAMLTGEYGKTPAINGVQKDTLAFISPATIPYESPGLATPEKFMHTLDMMLKMWTDPSAKTRPSGYLLDLSEMSFADALKTLTLLKENTPALLE